MKAKLLIPILSALILVGCSEPRKAVIPQTGALTNETFVAAAKQLKEDEKQQLTAWIMRKAFEGGVPAGFTIESALADQAKWKTEQDAVAAKQAEARTRLNQAVEWKTVDVVFMPRDISKHQFSDKLRIAMDVTNRSNKPITGIQGQVRLTNNFDTELGIFGYEDEYTIAPNETAQRYMEWDIFDKKLIDGLQEGKQVNTAFGPSKIIYQDGTKDGI
jgi:hypothetical protein